VRTPVYGTDKSRCRVERCGIHSVGMGLVDAFDKWVREHASASVMKDHVDLMRSQVAVAERKLTEAEAEKAKLQQEVQRLLSENQRLTSELQKLQPTGAAIHEEKKQILIAVAQRKDPQPANEIAQRLRLHLLKVEQALRDLEKIDFVYAQYYMGRPPTYTLGEEGTKYLIANNLLGSVGNPTRHGSSDHYHVF
jgi:regulator of replication initiation timing